MSKPSAYVRITHGWHDGPQLMVDARRNEGDYWEPYGATEFVVAIEEAFGEDLAVEDWPEGTYELRGHTLTPSLPSPNTKDSR